jgi:PAS domain S-box-containing protein
MVLSREITARIKEVLEKHPEGLSITDLVTSVDINRNTAGRYLENLLLSGQVEMRRFGMAKLYRLAKRLPVSSVLSLSSELVMQLDSGQRVFYANEPLLAFLGVPAKDLFGKNIEYTQFAVVFEDVFPGLLDRFMRGLKGEEWRGELSCPIRKSSFFCRIAPTVSNEGTKGVTVLLEDISVQKRDEERIRKSEARLRSIFKVSPVGIGVMANRVFLEVNDRLCQMTGYSAADLVGKSVRVLYASKEEFDRVGTLIYNQIQQSGTGSIETRWVKKDGMDIDVLLSSTPLDPANVAGGITITALDITERNKDGRALRESEDRYRKLVEISPDAVILHRHGKILYVNPASVRLLGAGNTEDLLGKNVLDFIQPEYRDAVRASIAKDLSGKTTPPMELQMLRVNGTPVVVEGRGVSTSINGSPAVLVAVNDITHRYQAGLALKKSEERYRTLAEASQDLIFLIGRDDRVEYVNSYAAAILGLPADQVIGGERSVLFPGELGQRQARGLGRVFETGKPGHSEGAMEINGALHWFDHYLMPIMDVHGIVTSVLGVSRDITDRKRAEQALQESGDQYRFIADNSLDIINRQTPDCICTYVSPAITPVLGYPETEVLGKSVLTMVHPDDLAMVQRDLVNIARNGLGHVTSTFRFRHRNGHYLWFESTTKIIRDEKTGQVREFLSISRDISARKSAGQETPGCEGITKSSLS